MSTSNDAPVTDPERDTQNGDTAPGATPTGSESDDSKAQDIKSLPAWAQREISKLNAEARTRRLQVKEADDAAKTQREASLAEKEEWKTLAEERATELGKLKLKAEQFDELSIIFEEQLTTEIKDWPSDLLEMAPSEDAPLSQKIKWLQKARPMAKKLMTTAPSDTAATRQPVGGNRRGPEPTTQSLRTQAPLAGNDGPLVDARKKF